VLYRYVFEHVHNLGKKGFVIFRTLSPKMRLRPEPMARAWVLGKAEFFDHLQTRFATALYSGMPVNCGATTVAVDTLARFAISRMFMVAYIIFVVLGPHCCTRPTRAPAICSVSLTVLRFPRSLPTVILDDLATALGQSFGCNRYTDSVCPNPTLTRVDQARICCHTHADHRKAFHPFITFASIHFTCWSRSGASPSTTVRSARIPALNWGGSPHIQNVVVQIYLFVHPPHLKKAGQVHVCSGPTVNRIVVTQLSLDGPGNLIPSCFILAAVVVATSFPVFPALSSGLWPPSLADQQESAVVVVAIIVIG